MTALDKTRFARHIVLPQVGMTGQQALQEATVLLVGLGGLGCPAALYLASSGIGRLLLSDFDTVDASNLPRQILYSNANVGQRKTHAAKQFLQSIAPSLVVETLEQRLDADGMKHWVDRADIVIDGTDNFTTRFLVNDACVAAQVPLVSGAAIRLEGQIVRFANDGRGPCYRCIYSEDDDWLGDCQGNGVLAPVTGVIGTMMALEAIKAIVNPQLGSAGMLSLWDAETGDWSRVAIRANADCPAGHN